MGTHDMNKKQRNLQDKYKFVGIDKAAGAFNEYVSEKASLYSKCLSVSRLMRELDDLEVVARTLFFSYGMPYEYLEVRAAIESRINYLVSMGRMGWAPV